MAVYTFKTPGLAIHTHIIIDNETKNAAIIDPTRNVLPLITFINNHNANLLYIIETHVHADFISGAKELKQQLDNKPIIACSAEGGSEWIPTYADQKIRDRDVLDLGTNKLEAWHTPGHTPEHLTYILYTNNEPVIAFTGDFLFPGSVGRPDLLGKEQLHDLTSKLYHSVFHVLSQLPEHLNILPAHGAGSLCAKAISNSENTTIKNERNTNPALQKQNPKEWEENLLKNMPKAPAYFPVMKQTNINGPAMLKDLKKAQEISPDSLLKTPLSDYFLLDIRHQEEFANQHIENSINIPFSPNLIRWAGEFVPYDMPIILIANSLQEILETIKNLQLIGLDHIAGYALANEIFFKILKPKTTSFPMPYGQDLLTQFTNIEIVDVRTDAEWNNGHIPNALHYEVNTIKQAFSNLSKDKNIAFICGSGYRSSIAASLAKKSGIKNVINIKGGMQAWQQAKLPLE